MHLANFPAELLGMCLHFADVSHIAIRLWKCGDTLLNAKLAQGLAEATWRCRDGFELEVPRMLLHLRNLRSLSLQSSKVLVKDASNWPSILNGLSKALESLSITSNDVNLVFLNYAPDWTTHEPTFITTEFKRGASRLVDIGLKFPALQTLNLSCSSSAARIQPEELLPALPSTLTSLKASTTPPRSSDWPFMALLPKSLTSMDLDLMLHFQTHQAEIIADWAEAPPQLRSIATVYWRHPPSHLDWLPRSLTHADLGSSPVYSSSLQSLPRGLVHDLRLEIGHKEGEEDPTPHWASTLPALQSLVAGSQIPFTPDVIAALPRSLTSLDVWRTADFNWLQFARSYTLAKQQGTLPSSLTDSIWPPGLTHLRFEMFVNNDESFEAIPRTLTSLELGIHLQMVPEVHMEEMPPLLQKLIVRIYNYSDKPATFVGDFSPNLKEVRVHSGSGQFNCQSLLEKLPESVTSIGLSDDNYHSLLEPSYFKKVAPWKFPSQLRSLELRDFHANWFNALPRTLTDLSIYELFFVNLKHPTDPLAGLPSTLTSLTIHNCHHHSTSPQLSETSFSSLTHLTVLNTYDVFGLPSAFLRHLPRSIKSLDVILSPIDYEDLAFLPPSLFVCELRGIELKHPNVPKYWPIAAFRHLVFEELEGLVLKRLAALDY